MRRTRLFVSLAVSAVPFLIPACGSSAPGEDIGSTADTSALAGIAKHPSVDVCGAVPAGVMRCHSKMRTDITNNSTPQGFGPADLQSAYNLPKTGGTGQTVAIVDSNDDPNAEADLAVYRAHYGLPPCTTANGCFKKVNQEGVEGSYPAADSGWAGEISLDLDMVSAVCPSCNILLVEATQATTADLGAAVNTAASLGATVISNSYGGSEDSTVNSSSSEYYNHPGILITASAGDNGYGAQFPASSQYVIGVGGTSLVTSTSARGWAESAWNGTGSGCSAYIAKPGFQTDPGCGKRTVADVSAVADPNTGVSVYDSYGGGGGWNVYGGTSAASPIVAATFALIGKGSVTNAYPYSNTSSFYDVTSGSNGTCSTSAPYLCTAGVGYDGPTGWGTPNGTALAGGASAPPPPPPQDAGAPASEDSGTTPPPKDSGTTSPPKDSGTTPPKDAGGTSTCTHSLCSTGKRQTESCSPCATEICEKDPYCCNSRWDSVCVGEVGSICGESCQ